MIIDKETYYLTTNNYIFEETDKDKIVIGNTFSTNMNHYIGWSTRYNGKYKKTANYTVRLDGSIYEHFNPKYHSNFTDYISLDKTIISIVLENEGWLIKDLNNLYYFYKLCMISYISFSFLVSNHRIHGFIYFMFHFVVFYFSSSSFILQLYLFKIYIFCL